MQQFIVAHIDRITQSLLEVLGTSKVQVASGDLVIPVPGTK